MPSCVAQFGGNLPHGVSFKCWSMPAPSHKCLALMTVCTGAALLQEVWDERWTTRLGNTHCTQNPWLCLQKLLSQTAVLKLNGGLGTSMGLEKAKSLLPVKDGKTFLDLIAEQITYSRKQFGAKVRFVLMNSFSTSDDTKAHLSKSHKDLLSEEDVELASLCR